MLQPSLAILIGLVLLIWSADRFVDVIIGEVQPVPAEHPEFGVELPNGTACLPDPPIVAPTQ